MFYVVHSVEGTAMSVAPFEDPYRPASVMPTQDSSAPPVALALIEALEDLAHDLGRHIRLPLALLPIDAPTTAVRDALERALYRTRCGPGGVWSADGLLAEFAAALPPILRDELGPLSHAVAQAEHLLDEPIDSTPLAREAIRRRVEAVPEAIAELHDRWQARALGGP